MINPYQAQNYVQAQPQQFYNPPKLFLKGRMVTSIEEAKAASIDFDGSIFYFPDLANKRIYTKQINYDGTASMNVYELRQIPIEQTPDYITRKEFEEAIRSLQDNGSQKAPKKEEVSSFNF